MIYVGETYRTLDERFREHLSSVINGSAETDRRRFPVGRHFNLPHHVYTDHLQVSAIWQNSKDRQYRKFMESSLIERLSCKEPLGINIRS